MLGLIKERFNDFFIAYIFTFEPRTELLDLFTHCLKNIIDRFHALTSRKLKVQYID